MTDPFLEERSKMVSQQLKAKGIHAPKVLESMQLVPRHLFVPSGLESDAYEDTALPIGYHQTISQPYIVGLMLQAADLKPTDSVLDIGTGCGYAAAVASLLVHKVYSIELVPELAAQSEKRLALLGYDNVTVLQGDGSIGLKKYAPFNAILVAAGTSIVPEPLKEQLTINGCLVIPVGNSMLQTLVSIKRLTQIRYQQTNLGMVRFVPLVQAPQSKRAC